MKRTIAMLLLVFVLAGDLGQEDFDSGDHGFYEIIEITNLGGAGGVLVIDECQITGGENWLSPFSGDCLQAGGTGTDPGALVQLDLVSAAQPAFINFTLGVNGFGGSEGRVCLLHTDLEPGDTAASVVASKCLWEIQIQEPNGGSDCNSLTRAGAPSTNTVGFDFMVGGGGTCQSQYHVEMDWTNLTVDIYREGGLERSDDMISGGSNAVGLAVQLRTQQSSEPSGVFDNWEISDVEGVISEDVDGPSEFDSGLIAFAASAGFISQESQLFFALVLIGLATVTTSASSKWVAPGRFKNYLLVGVQTLIAIFCVIAAFLDLWMFLVAFMLALFAVRGGSEVRNTYHQIREALQRQNDRAGDDIGPAQVMEVQVSEREEAVERAFQRLEDESAATDTGEVPDGPAEAVSDDRGGES